MWFPMTTEGVDALISYTGSGVTVGCARCSAHGPSAMGPKICQMFLMIADVACKGDEKRLTGNLCMQTHSNLSMSLTMAGNLFL